ncbi:unnamed protein product [Rotaria socialis]
MKTMAKPSQDSKQLPQVRIIRGNRPDGYPKLFDERVDSPIRSSVDSWLSSAPSIQPSKPKPITKKVDKPQPIAEDDETENDPMRKWIIVAIVIFAVLTVFSIVGIVLSVVFRHRASMHYLFCCSPILTNSFGILVTLPEIFLWHSWIK